MADGHGGSAQTLRDYWEGHGHSGPSHGAERDAIAWGTPGDFDRCVAQVTEHGHMTEEQAKGYCNLRHHGATGEWPAQHAKQDKGWSTAWEHELRGPHGQWIAGGSAPDALKPDTPGDSRPGPPGSKPTDLRTASAVHQQSRQYTDEQVAALQAQINQMRAEMHKESLTEARVAFAIRIGAIAASVAMAFFTGGLSLVALGPLLLEKTPEIGKEVAEFMQARSKHTQYPFTPLRPGEKSDDPAADRLAALLAEGGLDKATARTLAARLISAASAALAAGRKPWEDGFMPDAAVQQILSSVGGAVTKAQGSQSQSDGGGEARVAAGSGVTSGQWTTGSDGPTQNPPKPNPYGNKKQQGQKKPPAKKPAAKKPPAKKKTPKGQKKPAGKKPGSKQSGKQHAAEVAQEKAHIRGEIHGLENKLGDLKQEEASLKAKLPKSTASTGASSSSTSAGSKTGTSASASSSSKPASSSSSSSSSKPASSSSSSAVQQQLTQVQQQIQEVHQQIASLRQQLSKVKAWEAAETKAGRSVRDTPSGRFRTFEGESKEASHAFGEGRIGDAVDYLGSARALAPTPGHRTTLDTLQRSISRVQHVIPEVTKAGPKGAIHGWLNQGGFGKGEIAASDKAGEASAKAESSGDPDDHRAAAAAHRDAVSAIRKAGNEKAQEAGGLSGEEWQARSAVLKDHTEKAQKHEDAITQQADQAEGDKLQKPGRRIAQQLVTAAGGKDDSGLSAAAAELADADLQQAHEYLASKPRLSPAEHQVMQFLTDELDAINAPPVEDEEPALAG